MACYNGILQGIGFKRNTIMANTTRKTKGHTDKLTYPPPIKVKVKGPSWEKPFPVNGQGVLVFNISKKTPFAISVQQEKQEENWISLDIQENRAAFYMKAGKMVTPLQMVTTDKCGLEVGVKTSYWYSYDKERLVLKYGKGYRMEETTLMVHDFLKDVQDDKEQKEIREKLSPFFNPEKKIVAKLYDMPVGKAGRLLGSVEDTEPEVQFDKYPFVCNIPPLVMDSSKVNLFFLDEGDFVFSASLPPACRELYQNVRTCELSYAGEVDQVLLSDAIRHSITTEGCLLYKKLQEKAGEFGPEACPHENYLRVTLGHSLGKSPGIPYVLELWPSQNFSPIHNHGNANAVIKVLFGSIQISIYNKQTTDTNATPLKTFDAHAGNFTWISRNWYQTHKLHNVTDDFCATVQCYTYDDGDTTYWPYFDYVADRNTIQEFLPNSDFGFKDMRDKVVEEYKAFREALKMKALPTRDIH